MRGDDDDGLRLDTIFFVTVAALAAFWMPLLALLIGYAHGNH